MIISLYPHSNPIIDSVMVLFTFCRSRNWDLENLSYVLMVTQVISLVERGLEIRPAYIQNLCSWPSECRLCEYPRLFKETWIWFSHWDFQKKGSGRSSYLVRSSLLILCNLCGCGCNGWDSLVSFSSFKERWCGHSSN